MKLVILAPSQEYQSSAGARIRYGRVAPRIAAAGISLSIEDIAQFDPANDECDVLIVSKCYDARALVAAETMARRGARVGVDLFDDYFSDHSDSRLVRLRLWLRQLLGICDFAMCSTPALAEVISGYRSQLPVHVLDDPAPDIDYGQLARTLAQKLCAAHAERRIRLCWFGMGDNPYFEVGLSDLAAFAGMIAQLSSGDMAVELSILTNARALDARRLGMVASLPVPATVEEWSEAREVEVLRDSLACFLPVNAQSFSAAKSLNRAITAMAAGCQVLSAGYPLYSRLEPFIYRDAENFLGDLRLGGMRLSADRFEEFRARIDAEASPEGVASALATFLLGLGDKKPLPPTPLYLIHGFGTTAAAHKMVQTLGGLSICTPFCTAGLDFDVIFEVRTGREVAMLVSDSVRQHLRSEYGVRALRRQIGKRRFWELASIASSENPTSGWTGMSLPLQLALYPSIMRAVSERLDDSFGPGKHILSEVSPWPFEANA